MSLSDVSLNIKFTYCGIIYNYCFITFSRTRLKTYSEIGHLEVCDMIVWYISACLLHKKSVDNTNLTLFLQ